MRVLILDKDGNTIIDAYEISDANVDLNNDIFLWSHKREKVTPLELSKWHVLTIWRNAPKGKSRSEDIIDKIDDIVDRLQDLLDGLKREEQDE